MQSSSKLLYNLKITYKSRKFSTSKFDAEYKECLIALNTLQSNASSIASWSSVRQNLKHSTDLLDETRDHFDQLRKNSYNPSKFDTSNLRAIHVAGTKGKGSTCAFSESIFRSCGLKTGLYTSPHLVSVRERICIDGIPIEKELFIRKFWECWNIFKKTSKPMPSFFRFLTLLAFKVFLDEGVDVAVIETGIGGRTDATNMIQKPIATGITPLGFDHMELLGNSILEIAFEKSGIFKEGIQPFSSPQLLDPNIIPYLKQRAIDLSKKELIVVEPLADGSISGLGGRHNLINASLAIAMCDHWFQQNSFATKKYSKKGFSDGVANAIWLGRSQILKLNSINSFSFSNITLYLDGAHTQESLQTCKNWFDERKSNCDMEILVFNCTKPRDPTRLFKPLVDSTKTFDYVLFTSNSTGRNHILQDKKTIVNNSSEFQTWQEFLKSEWLKINTNKNQVEVNVQNSIPETLSQLLEIESKNPHKKIDVLITGSLHLIGAWLELLSTRYNYSHIIEPDPEL